MADHRISQGVVEALAGGTPLLRTSQVVVEVLAGAATARRISQAAIEVLTPNYADDGGDSTGTNPPAATLASTTPQFFAVLEEIDDGTIIEAYAEAEGGPFSDPSTYFGGYKERRVISFGTIGRKTNTPAGGLQATSLQLVFDDSDRYFRSSWGTTPRIGRKLSIYVVDHADRLAGNEPFRLIAGVVTQAEPLDELTYGLTIEGMLGRHISRLQTEKKVPPNLVTAAENPILAERFQDGWSPAIGYGVLSDETSARPQGVVPGYYIGSANLQTVFGGGALNVVGDFIAFFGHAVQDMLNLYVTPAAWTSATVYLVGDRIRPNTTSNGFLYQCMVAGTSGSSAPTFPTTVGATVGDGGVTWQNIGADDPALRYVIPSSAYGQILIEPTRTASWTAATGSIDRFLDYNGYRYHVAIFDHNHRFAKAIREGRIQVTGNFRGVEDRGDGLGKLITAPSRIVRHFWENFVETTYTTGLWLATPPAFGAYSVFDTTTIEAVKTYTDTLVSGGPVEVALLIGEGGKQTALFDVVKQMTTSWDLKLSENRHGQIITTMVNPAAAAAVTLTDQHDVISLTTSPRRDDYFNTVRYRHGYLYAPPVATQLEGAEGQPMPANPVNEHAQWASGRQVLKDAAAIALNYGKEVYLDLDLYGVRDAATAAMYAARALARGVGPMLEGPIGVSATTGLQGLQQGATQIDFDTTLGLDHIEGLGVSGFVGATVALDEISLEPEGCRVVLTGLLQA